MRSALALAILRTSAYGWRLPHFLWHLPVTEGHALPPQKRRSNPLRQFRLAKWIVPPIIVPLLLLILVIAAAAFNS